MITARVAHNGADYYDDSGANFLSVGGYSDCVSLIVGNDSATNLVRLTPEEALEVARGLINAADASMDLSPEVLYPREAE